MRKKKPAVLALVGEGQALVNPDMLRGIAEQELYSLGLQEAQEAHQFAGLALLRARDGGLILMELDRRHDGREGRPHLARQEVYDKFRRQTGLTLSDYTFDGWKGLAFKWDDAKKLLGDDLLRTPYTKVKKAVREGKPPQEKPSVTFTAAVEELKANPQAPNPYKAKTPKHKEFEQAKEKVKETKVKDAAVPPVNAVALLDRVEVELTEIVAHMPKKVSPKVKTIMTAQLKKVKERVKQLEAALAK